MTVTMTRPGEAEALRAGPVTFRVLQDGGAVGGRSGVVEFILPAGWDGPPQHIHREHDETFYVLTGTVKFTSGTNILIAPAGSLVTAPTGAPHTFANPDPQAPASLLCILTPERYIGYFRELAMLEPGPDGMLAPEKMLAIMRRYATQPFRP
jgi:mannose-6-phosphate isomerase-like protein (cupin superfamily)